MDDWRFVAPLLLGASLRVVTMDMREVVGTEGLAHRSGRPWRGAPASTCIGSGACDARDSGSEAPAPPAEPIQYYRRRRERAPSGMWFGVLLVLVGIMILARETGVLRWWSWAMFWPLALIALGLLILARRLR